MTDSLASASDAFAGILAARARQDLETRRKTITRAIASIAVALLHVAFLYVLVIAERMPIVRKAAAPAEVLLILAPVERPAALPRIINANPEKKREPVQQEYEPRPITLPPVVSPPQQPVDIMRALGVELACGASHYEYLNPVERKLCHHAPWKMPDVRNIAIAPAPPQQGPLHLTGAEAAARERAQAPACPAGVLVCPDQVIYGKGPH